jgi:hypothetical protein
MTLRIPLGRLSDLPTIGTATAAFAGPKVYFNPKSLKAGQRLSASRGRDAPRVTVEKIARFLQTRFAVRTARAAQGVARKTIYWFIGPR